MSKKDLIGKGLDEYRVERLIETEVRLINEFHNTRPFNKKKKSSLLKKILKTNKERNIQFAKLKHGIKDSLRIKRSDCDIEKNHETQI